MSKDRNTLVSELTDIGAQLQEKAGNVEPKEWSALLQSFDAKKSEIALHDLTQEENSNTELTDQLTEKQTKIEELEATIAEKQTEIDGLTEQVGTIEGIQTELTTATEKVAELEASLEAANNTNTELNEANEKLAKDSKVTPKKVTSTVKEIDVEENKFDEMTPAQLNAELEREANAAFNNQKTEA